MRTTNPLFTPITHLWGKLWNSKKIPRKTQELLLILVTVTIAITFAWVIQALMLVFVLQSVPK
jgi:alkylhydroperoxidase/carboxymuconolactone decarboxylase family protein YurZ